MGSLKIEAVFQILTVKLILFKKIYVGVILMLDLAIGLDFLSIKTY